MPNVPQISQGAKLSLSANGTTYYELELTESIDNALAITSESIDVTHLGSTKTQMIKGLSSYPAITASFQYDYNVTLHNVLMAHLAAYGSGTAAVIYCKIELPAATEPIVVTGTGHLTNYSASLSTNQKMVGTLTFQPNGAMTVTEAA